MQRRKFAKQNQKPKTMKKTNKTQQLGASAIAQPIKLLSECLGLILAAALPASLLTSTLGAA